MLIVWVRPVYSRETARKYGTIGSQRWVRRKWRCQAWLQGQPRSTCETLLPPPWGFPNIGEECEWREVLLREEESLGSTSIILQQNPVCVVEGVLLEEAQLLGLLGIMEYYSSLKRSEVLKCTITWINLENTMIDESYKRSCSI